jgi:hypothetical protein
MLLLRCPAYKTTARDEDGEAWQRRKITRLVLINNSALLATLLYIYPKYF